MVGSLSDSAACACCTRGTAPKTCLAFIAVFLIFRTAGCRVDLEKLRARVPGAGAKQKNTSGAWFRFPCAALEVEPSVLGSLEVDDPDVPEWQSNDLRDVCDRTEKRGDLGMCQRQTGDGLITSCDVSCWSPLLLVATLVTYLVAAFR